MEFLPHGRASQIHRTHELTAAAGAARPSWPLGATLAICRASGIGSRAAAASLKATVAQANKLSNEIDSLGQQYDNLRIQLSQALAEAKIARLTAQREQKALGLGQTRSASSRPRGSWWGASTPTIQLLQSTDPQTFLDRASIMLQLQHQQGSTVSLLAAATAAANRATLTATQQAAKAKKLTAR